MNCLCPHWEFTCTTNWQLCWGANPFIWLIFILWFCVNFYSIAISISVLCFSWFTSLSLKFTVSAFIFLAVVLINTSFSKIVMLTPFSMCFQLGSRAYSCRWRSGFTLDHSQCVFPFWILSFSLFILCSPLLESSSSLVCMIGLFSFSSLGFLISWMMYNPRTSRSSPIHLFSCSKGQAPGWYFISKESKRSKWLLRML